MNPRDRDQPGRHRGRWHLETYNPEPQWLQQDRAYQDRAYQERGYQEDRASEQEREYRNAARREDELEYGERQSGLGRGSYAGTGREWGESERARGYERTNRDFGGRDYGTRDEQRIREEREYDRRSLGDATGHSTYSGYGAPSRGEQKDWRSGYEASGWEEDDLDLGRRGYEPFRVGTGMGLGPTGWRHDSGYGSRAGWDLGAHQRDFAADRGWRQESFRGMGPKDYKRADERIRDDIHERLTDSHVIDARNIMVEVNQGNVTLSGTVGERRMRYAAEDLVERVGGVANINNQLRVQAQQEAPSGPSTPASRTTDDDKRH